MQEKGNLNLSILILIVFFTTVITVLVIVATSSEPIYEFQVVDGNDEPLEGASVKITSKNEEFRTTSNKNGEFTITLPSNEIQIKVIKPGYKSFSDKIIVSNERLSIIELRKIEEEPETTAIKVFTETGLYEGELTAFLWCTENTYQETITFTGGELEDIIIPEDCGEMQVNVYGAPGYEETTEPLEREFNEITLKEIEIPEDTIDDSEYVPPQEEPPEEPFEPPIHTTTTSPDPTQQPPAPEEPPSENLTIITVGENVLRSNVKRFGLNIASPLSYDPSVHYMKNILINPGFESSQKGRMMNLKQNNPGLEDTIIQDSCWDTAWNNDAQRIGEPEGFWDNAEFEILTGNSKGTKGNVQEFSFVNDESGKSRYTFTLDQQLTDYSEGEVVAIRKEFDPNYIESINRNFGEQLYWDSTEKRSETTGEQSLRLNTNVNTQMVRWKFDDGSSPSTGGKDIIIKGDWSFSIWAKAENEGDKIRVAWQRQGLTPFLMETIPVTTSWQEYRFDFSVPNDLDKPNENYGIILLAISTAFQNNSGYVWIDDASLGVTSESNPTEFSDVFVNSLKEFQPGMIRNWNAFQHGSTLDNQLADIYARKTTGSSPRYRSPIRFTYSLHEFLELAKELDADPWYVMPPTFSDEDLTNLVDYLAGSASTEYGAKRSSLGQSSPWTSEFDAIYIEFANEAWGSNCPPDPFAGAGTGGPLRLAITADNRFSIMKNSPNFDSGKIKLVIGGMQANTITQQAIRDNSTSHDSVTISAYHGLFTDHDDTETIFGSLYASPFFGTSENHINTQNYELISPKEITIYEVNYGAAIRSVISEEGKNNILTSVGAGIQLPLRMLLFLQKYNAKYQNVFQAFQYAYTYNQEIIKVWGIFRGLDNNDWSRPTGLGVETANKALFGDMVETQQTGTNPLWTQEPANDITEQIEVNYIQSFAFKEGSKKSLIIFNLHRTDALDVRIDVPGVGCENADWFELTSDDIYDNNEESENVTIEQKIVSENCELTLAPFSINTLVWE